jgi:hypothetical protein
MQEGGQSNIQGKDDLISRYQNAAHNNNSIRTNYERLDEMTKNIWDYVKYDESGLLVHS